MASREGEMDEVPGSTLPSTPRHGRLRRGENEPPPLWFGLVFALVGGSVLAFGVSLGQLIVAGFGLFFGAIGVAMTLTTITAERGRRAFRAQGQRGPVDVFTRSPMRILMDLVLAPLGGIGFLGFSLIWPLLAGPIGIVGTAMFVFFGVFMLLGAAVTMRRGIRRAIAEVGPDGIWTAELPRRLAWSEIERVELESAVGAAGESGLAVYRRLGIWPRTTIPAPAPLRAGAGMARFFTGLVNSMGRGAGLSDPSRMAPFGIQAFEIEQDLAEVTRSVERYVDVLGVQRGEEEIAEARLVPPAPPLDGLPGAIAANLARQAGHAEPVPAAIIEAGPAPATAPLPPLGGPVDAGPLAFRRRADGISIRGQWSDAWGALFMTLFAIPWFGFQVVVAPALAVEAWLLILPFDLGVLALFAYGVAGLLELPGRWRMGRGDPVLAAVDERGLEIRGMGRLGWGQIAEARVVTSAIPVNEGSPAIRRLEIVPIDPARLDARPWSDRAYDRFQAFTRRLNPLRRRSARTPGAFSLDLDLLEDGEGLLDAIARYRLVDERGWS